MLEPLRKRVLKEMLRPDQTFFLPALRMISQVVEAVREDRGAVPLFLSASRPLFARWLSRVAFFSDSDRQRWPHLFSPRLRDIRGGPSSPSLSSPLARSSS